MDTNDNPAPQRTFSQPTLRPIDQRDVGVPYAPLIDGLQLARMPFCTQECYLFSVYPPDIIYPGLTCNRRTRTKPSVTIALHEQRQRARKALCSRVQCLQRRNITAVRQDLDIARDHSVLLILALDHCLVLRPLLLRKRHHGITSYRNTVPRRPVISEGRNVCIGQWEWTEEWNEPSVEKIPSRALLRGHPRQLPASVIHAHENGLIIGRPAVIANITVHRHNALGLSGDVRSPKLYHFARPPLEEKRRCSRSPPGLARRNPAVDHAIDLDRDDFAALSNYLGLVRIGQRDDPPFDLMTILLNAGSRCLNGHEPSVG